MSFFGKPASSSSVFGSLNLDTSVPASSDPAAKRKSIFEPSSTTEERSKANMFGNAAGSQASATPSLFGSAPSSKDFASSGGGIFGSTTVTSGASTSGTSSFSFGKPAAANSAPGAGTTASSGTGLFGTTLGQPSKPSGGLFAQPTSAPTQPSIFGTVAPQPAASNAAQPQSTTQQNDLPHLQNRESAYFNGLLERQKKKMKFSDADQGGLNQLPSMNMDLNDLARRAQELNQKSQRFGQPSGRDSRAHYLLSGSGVTPGQAYREFQKLDTDTIPVAQSTRIDFAEEGSAYIKGMQARGREAMLRESMDRVYRDVDKFIEDSLGIDFDEQKKRIMQHFGLMAKDDQEEPVGKNSFNSLRQSKAKSTRRSIFGRSGLEKSVIGDPSLASSTAFGGLPTNLTKYQTVADLRNKERLFIEKVQALNKARLSEDNYKVLHQFQEVEMTVQGDVPKQLVDAYSALGYITQEQSADKGLKPRIYAAQHAQLMDKSSDLELKKQIIAGSRTFLEETFYRELETVVQKNPQQAQIGGMPTVINTVRAYIRVRSEKHDLAPDGATLDQLGDNDKPEYYWAVVFYLLRSGHVKEAAEYLDSNPAFLTIDRRFVSYVRAFASSSTRTLSKKMQDMVNGEYNQRRNVAQKNTVDPYRIACLKIVGRCETEQRSLELIGQGVEDWLWLQFVLARENESLDVSQPFGLDQIVDTVREIGEKHFQKAQSESGAYGTFFLMQILAGMFEQAVSYLHDFNPLSAVHAAIALDYYGLLRVSNYQTAGNELLTTSTTNQQQINFVPLIAYYTATFRAALPTQAVDYLALICLNSDLPKPVGDIMTNACHECLRELCLETREFAALLGDIRSDGSRIAGAIEQRAQIINLATHEHFVRFITSQAAAVADSRGQIADAVLLYHLCDDYDNAVAVLNRSLADAVTIELGEEPMSLQPLKPRNSNGSDNTSQASQANSSLSLTQSTSSPLELAKNIITLYNTNAQYFSKVSQQNRTTCSILMTMLSARAKIENPNSPDYLAALEELNELGVLPLGTNGEIAAIRNMATQFSTLPQVVARCAGLVILWCVRAISAEREHIAREGTWGVSGDEMNGLKGQLNQMAKDLMVFAGLVRYKLPGRVYDMLTRAGSDVGDY